MSCINGNKVAVQKLKDQGRQSTRWKEEIRQLAAAGWSTLTLDKEKWRPLSNAFVLQWTSFTMMMTDTDPAGDAEAVEQYEVRGLVAASLYEVAVRAFTRAGPGPLSSPRIVDSTGDDGGWHRRRMSM